MARVEHSRWMLVARRAIDLTIAVLGLIVTSPLVLVLAAGVKATSSGPVLFRQTRMGRDGLRFEVLKFRTMQDGTHAEILDDEVAREAYRMNDFKLQPDDPRITRIGRFLRKTSLDELPQLVNVVLGQMSIVGIRPLLPEELALRLAYDIALYRTLRPGLTGLWQVEGRSSVAHADRFALDRSYVEHWNVWNDVRIILRTPLALLRTAHAQ